MEALGYIASVAMGITLGLLGGGGSIMTVPIMVYLFALPPSIATGHSLFVVGLTAFIGFLLYLRKGDVDFKTGFLFAIPSILGVNISRGILIPRIPETITNIGSFALTKDILVMAAFAALMLAASTLMIWKQSTEPPPREQTLRKSALLILEGLVVGLVAGFVGAGGGFLIIPALVFLAGLRMRVAVGTSLLIIALQSLLGFAGDVLRGAVIDWRLLGYVAAFAMVGIVIGSAIAHKVKEQKLKLAFGWLVLIMGTAILIDQFKGVTAP